MISIFPDLWHGLQDSVTGISHGLNSPQTAGYGVVAGLAEALLALLDVPLVKWTPTVARRPAGIAGTDAPSLQCPRPALRTPRRRTVVNNNIMVAPDFIWVDRRWS